jgi:hypothetical protein
LLGFRQQRISALAIHCREIKRDSPAVVLLCQTLFFEVGQITADSISETCSFSASSVILAALFTQNINDIFLPGGFVHVSFNPAKCRNKSHITAFCGKGNIRCQVLNLTSKEEGYSAFRAV